MLMRLSVAVLVFMLANCMTALAGQPYKQTYKLKNFDYIETRLMPGTKGRLGNDPSARLNVEIIKAKEYSVTLELDDDDFIEKYEVKKVGRTLVIESGALGRRDHGKKVPTATVTVRTPYIFGLDLKGVADVTMRGRFRPSDLNVEVGGAVRLNGLSADCRNVSLRVDGVAALSYINLYTHTCKFECGGASSVDKAKLVVLSRTKIELSGSAIMKALDFTFSDVDIKAGGTSSLYDCLAVFDNADIVASGASTIDVEGSFGKNEVSTSGSALVTIAGKHCRGLDVSCSGASTVNAKDLLCGHVSVSADGASRVSATAIESIAFELKAGAILDYYGNPPSVQGSSSNADAH